MKPSKLLLTSLLAAAAMGANAYATGLADATLAIESFATDNIAGLINNGWEFSGLFDGDFGTGGDAGTYTTGGSASGSKLTITSGNGTSLYTAGSGNAALFSGIVTVQLSDFTADGRLLEAAKSGLSIGVGCDASGNLKYSGTWSGQNGFWGSASLALGQYADTDGYVTLGVVYDSNKNMHVYVGGGDGTLYDSGFTFSNANPTEIRLSNLAGVTYKNLYWFNSAVSEADMKSMLNSVAGVNIYTWAGTEDSHTWSGANWSKDGASVSLPVTDTVVGNSALTVSFSAASNAFTTVELGGTVLASKLVVTDGNFEFSGTGTINVAGLDIKDGASITLGDNVELRGTTVLHQEGQTQGRLQYVKGTGTVSLMLPDGDGRGVKAPDFNGTLHILENPYTDVHSRLRLDEITLGDSAKIVLDDKVDLRVNGAIADGFKHDIAISGETTLYYAGAGNVQVELKGALSGAEAGVLTVGVSGDDTVTTSAERTLVLSGNVALKGLTIAGDKTRIVTLQNPDGETRTRNIDAVVLDNATGTLNVNAETTIGTLTQNTGTVNVNAHTSVGGALKVGAKGNGVVNVKSGGTLVAGTLVFGQENYTDAQNGGSVVNVESNGTLIVGEATKKGFINNKNSALNLKGGTLGTTADSMTISGGSLPVVLAESTTSTIDTRKYDATAKQFTETGAQITVDNVISGAGALTKAGAGTLTLSGANTYAGGTTVDAGTLVAGNANALGTGNVTVKNGATLQALNGLQVGRAAVEEDSANNIAASEAIAGSFVTEGAVNLVLGELNADTAAITVQGDVTLSNSTIFDVAKLVNGGKLFSYTGTLTLSGEGSIDGDNFLRGGATLGSRTTITLNNDTENKLVSLSVTMSKLNLTWNGGESNTWKNNGSGWTTEDGGTTETFQTGDNVTFGASAAGTVTVDGVVGVADVTIESDSDYTFNGTNDASIGSAGTLTKTGAGTATFASSVDMSRFTGSIVVEAGTLSMNYANNAELSGALSGAGTFVKTGAGTLTLNTISAGTDNGLTLDVAEGGVKLVENADGNASTLKSLSVSGVLTVSGGTTTVADGTTVETGGTVEITSGGASADLRGGITVKDGGKLILSSQHALGYEAATSAGDITVNQGGELVLNVSALNGFTGGTLTLNGVMKAGSKMSTGSSDARWDFYGASKLVTSVAGATIESGLNVGFTQGEVEFNMNGADASLTIAANIVANDQGTGVLRKTGEGTLTLSGTNTFVGGVKLEAGTLVATSNTALGTGTLYANGSDGKDEVTLTLGETASGEALTLGNAISVAAGKTLILNSTNAGNTLTGVISGAGDVVIGDGSTVSLGGTNTNHAATFHVNAGGTLKVTGHDSFYYNNTSTGGIVMQGEEGKLATFVVADRDGANAGSLTLSKNITLNGHTLISSEGTSSFNSFGGKITATGTDNTVSSAIQVRNEFTVEVTNEGDELTFSGVLSNGNGGNHVLTKTGAGTLTLSHANTFSGGTKILGGNLGVGNNTALGSGTVTLNGGQLTAQIANLSLSNAVNIAENGGVVNTQATKVTLSGAVSGTGTLTKTGTGTLALGGNVRTIEGKIVVETGILQFGDNTANLNIAKGSVGKIEVQNGATLFLSGSSGSHHEIATDIVLKDGAMLRYHDSSQSNATNYQYEISGNLQIDGNAKLTCTSNWAKEVALLGNLSGSGTLNYYRGNGDGDYNANGRLIIAGADNSGFTGKILVGGQTIKQSQGLDLNANLANGTIELKTGTANGASPAFIRVLKSATVKCINGDANSRIGIGNVTAGGAVGAYTLTIGEGTFAGTIEDNGYARQYGSNTASKVTGAELSLVKTGAGTLTLSGTNTFSGGVTIEAGTLVAANANALGAATGTVKLSGGQLSVRSGVTLAQTNIEIALGSAYANTAAITGEGLLAEGATITIGSVSVADMEAAALAARAAIGNDETWRFQIADADSSIANALTKDSFVLSEALKGGWVISDYTNGLLTIAIPEPSAFGLLAGLGALALAGSRRRRRKA